MAVFFDQLLQNSLCASLLILAILLFRRLTGDLTKLYVHILWIITLLVLVVPPIPLGLLPTPRSLVTEIKDTFSAQTEDPAQNTEAEQSEEEQAKAEQAEGGKAQKEAWKTGEGGEGTGYFWRNLLHRGQGFQVKYKAFTWGITEILWLLWALGAAVWTACSLIQWLDLRKRVAGAVRIRRDVWSTEEISTPFVMPGLPSRIYIPRELEGEREQLDDILKHERRHIRNRDPWIKCFAVLALILHWFNPLVWLAFCLMNRDMEMYCDECVLRRKSMAEKRHYAQTLLDFACKSRGFSPAVYFGESSTKRRIWHVLNTKRPGAVVGLILLLTVSVCGLSFLTTRAKEQETALTDTRKGEMLSTSLAKESTAGPKENSLPAEGEEDHWTDQTIVGSGHKGLEPGFSRSEMSLMGETEHFGFYSMEAGEAMVVQTPECLVYAQVPVISNYEVEPLLLEQDFDEDGQAELAVITYVLHGTGISIRSLFVTDQAADSSWNIYQYREEEYLAELTPHFDTQYQEEGVRLVFDGTPTGVIEEVDSEELENEYAYYAGSQIDFRFVEGKIFLRAELAGYSGVNYTGNYPGHELHAQVCYEGEGRWKLANLAYADAGITEVIEAAIPLYLTGQTDQVNEYYTMPGTELPDFGEPGREVVILSVTYPTDHLDSGEVEAYVTIRQDGEDSLQYLHVPMKRVSRDIGGSWWKIGGEIAVER